MKELFNPNGELSNNEPKILETNLSNQNRVVIYHSLMSSLKSKFENDYELSYSIRFKITSIIQLFTLRVHLVKDLSFLLVSSIILLEISQIMNIKRAIQLN